MKRSIESQVTSYAQVVDDAIASHAVKGSVDDTRSGRTSRRGARVLVALAATAAAFTAVLFLLPSSQAWAGWTPATQTPDPTDVAALDAVCRATPAVADSLPALVFDIRGEGGAAIYGDERGWASCQADRSNSDGFEVISVQGRAVPDLSLAQAAVSASRPVVTIALSWQNIDDAASLIWGVTDPSIAAIEVVTSSGTVAATVVDGVWTVWWPGRDAETANIRALNSLGERVVDDAATRLAMPLPNPSTIVAAVGLDGTDLERSVLADGSVTWTELQLGLAAWQACVMANGYELTIEVDQATSSYQAISPTVGVAAEFGQPDDAAGEALLAPIMEIIDACYETELRRIAQVHVQQ